MQDIVHAVARDCKVADHVIAGHGIALAMPWIHIAFADGCVFMFYQRALDCMDADYTVATVDAVQFQLFNSCRFKADSAVIVREGIYLNAFYDIVFRIYRQSQMIRAVVAVYSLARFIYLMRSNG